MLGPMLTRRGFLIGAAAASLPAAASAEIAASQTLALWPDGAPGGGGPGGERIVSAKGAVTNIALPGLELFAPDAPNGMAVLVTGGGGYKRIEMGKEVYPAARWLAAHGVTAFALTYRLPGEGWTDGRLAPLQDAQRAVRLIRANAERFHIRRDRIGVLGFSAGGHLLGLAAVRANFPSYSARDAADAVSARPDFVALIYPVVTLLPPYDHTSTRRILIGRHPGEQLAAEWSVQTWVSGGSPPMFLVQAASDPISDPANTAILEAACQRAGVPVVRHLFPSGGHGFGMGRPGTPTERWSVEFGRWLARFGAAGTPG